MRNFKGTWLIGVAAWGLLGCGSDPSTIETEEDARLAYAAFNDQLVLVSGQLEFDASGSGSAELPCEGGGTSKISVSTTVNADRSGTTGTQNSEVSGCVVGNLTMDGEVAATANVSVSGQTLSVSGHFEGTVTFAGDPEGVCYMNVNIEGSGSEGKISGTICGFPAEEIAPSN